MCPNEDDTFFTLSFLTILVRAKRYPSTNNGDGGCFCYTHPMSERHLTRTAVFVILEKDGKIFFLRRANTGWADGMLTVPAGHVDKGDNVTEAAIIETKEEACVDVTAEDLEFLLLRNRT